jgi:hypothetical protein
MNTVMKFVGLTVHLPSLSRAAGHVSLSFEIERLAVPFARIGYAALFDPQGRGVFFRPTKRHYPPLLVPSEHPQ